MTSLVERDMGAGDPEAAHKATMSGVKLASVYACLTFAAFCILPRAMVNV